MSVNIKFVDASNFESVFQSWDLSSQPKTVTLREDVPGINENSIIFVHDPSLGSYIEAQGILYGNDSGDIEQFIQHQYEQISKLQNDVSDIQDRIEYNNDVTNKSFDDVNANINMQLFLSKLVFYIIENSDNTYSANFSPEIEEYIDQYFLECYRKYFMYEISQSQYISALTFSHSIIIRYQDTNGNWSVVPGIVVSHNGEYTEDDANTIRQTLTLYKPNGDKLEFTRLYRSGDFSYWTQK